MPQHFFASIALIRDAEHLEQRWFAFRDHPEGPYRFVVAERLQKESWRECLDREVAWTLQLNRGRDYLISSMARLHLEETIVDSMTQQEQEVTIEFYVVDSYGQSGRAALESHPDFRWVSNKELRAGMTDDGSLIDAWLVNLLRRADLIPRG